jgi:hypothetical protein
LTSASVIAVTSTPVLARASDALGVLAASVTGPRVITVCGSVSLPLCAGALLSGWCSWTSAILATTSVGSVCGLWQLRDLTVRSSGGRASGHGSASFGALAVTRE